MKEKITHLPYETTMDPEAVENLFCKPLHDNGVREPLTEDMMSVMMALVLSDENKIDEMFNSAKQISIAVPIFESRTKMLGLDLDKKTIIFFGLISATPGNAVMYSYYLAYIAKSKVRTMKFDDIMTDVFPVGMFTEKTLIESWDSQKVNRESNHNGSDNLLDYPTAAVSLSKEVVA